jgi:hypothetical protein
MKEAVASGSSGLDTTFPIAGSEGLARPQLGSVGHRSGAVSAAPEDYESCEGLLVHTLNNTAFSKLFVVACDMLRSVK